MQPLSDAERNEANLRAIEAWLAETFPEASIEGSWVRDGDYYLFRVHRTDEKWSEIQFERNALDDRAAEEIIVDLKERDAGPQMVRATSHRLTYTNERNIRFFETMVVECDGVSYRVTREEGGAVLVRIDGSRDVLPGMMKGMAVMDGSIYRVPLSTWIEDIRRWRRKDT